MNCYFLLAMFAIAVITCFSDASAQESNQPIPDQENVSPWNPSLQTSPDLLIQKKRDIDDRESLLKTSLRDLRFRCGRYWVDNYSKLIAPDDREIGIWGIDIPAAKFVPMRR